VTIPDLSLAKDKPTTFIYPGDIRVMDQRELEIFLTDISEEDKRQSADLWKSYTGRKELIDFTAGTPGGSTRARRRFGYDPDTMTYSQQTKTTSKTLGQRSIKMDVNRFALGIQAEQRKLMSDLMNKQITPQEWYAETTRLMKLSYLASVTVARGTNEPMDEEENNYWLLLLLLLFLKLNSFVEALANEEIPLNLKIPIYAGLRGGASRSVYENWKLFQATRGGYDEGRRILSPAEHCEESVTHPGCIEEAGRGWVPIGSIIPLGQCTCRDNCKCYLQFRKTRRSI